MSSILKTIENIKNQGGLALAQAYDDLIGHPFSEKDLANSWRAALQKNSDFYEEGWYDPPPHGIIALFGKPADGYQRICQSSFRPEHMWPHADKLYNSEDILTVYASPVHRRTNLIGDFGLNLYGGTDPAIKEHFENVLQTTIHIAQQAKVGMTFKELYQLGMEHGASQGFVNNIASPSDSTGTNIGHTIPLSFQSDSTHAAIAGVKTFADIKEALRTSRKFLNVAETQRIENDTAFTVEPRFSTTSMPNTWFHLTVVFENGVKRICHGFKPIFARVGMNHMLKLLPE